MRQKACRLSHLEDSLKEEKRIDKLVKAQRKRERKEQFFAIRVDYKTQIYVPKGTDVEKAIKNYREKHEK